MIVWSGLLRPLDIFRVSPRSKFGVLLIDIGANKEHLAPSMVRPVRVPQWLI
jgi:hypothetical protein